MTEMRWMHARPRDARPDLHRRGAALAAAAVLAVAAACGEGEVTEGGAHEPVARIDVVDARTETMQQRHIDSAVVVPLMTLGGPGRIIYDQPPSLANVEAADTLVRRENTGSAAPETPGRVARDSAAARAGAADARRGRTPGQSGAQRDTSGGAQGRPDRR